MLRNNQGTLSAELQEQINQAESKALNKFIAQLQQAGIDDDESIKLLLKFVGRETRLKTYTNKLITLFNVLGKDAKRYATFLELISLIASQPEDGFGGNIIQGEAEFFGVIWRYHHAISDVSLLKLKELVSSGSVGLRQLANLLDKLDLSLFNDKELSFILDTLEQCKEGRRSDIAVCLRCLKKNGLYDEYIKFILKVMHGSVHMLRVALEKLDANHQLNKETLPLFVKAKQKDYPFIVKCLASLQQHYPPYLELIDSFGDKDLLSSIIRPLQSDKILNEANLDLFQKKLDGTLGVATAMNALADYHLLNQENLNKIFNHKNPASVLSMLHHIVEWLSPQQPLTKNMFEQCLLWKKSGISSRLFVYLGVRNEAQFNQAYEPIDILAGVDVLHMLEQLPRDVYEQNGLLMPLVALCQQHRQETAAQIQTRCVNYLRTLITQNQREVPMRDMNLAVAMRNPSMMRKARITSLFSAQLMNQQKD